jgi:anti-sigma B factor antagonist
MIMLSVALREPGLRISTEMRGAVAVVTVHGEDLDARTSPELRAELEPVLAVSARVVLDLCEVQHLDSSGLGAILSTLRQVNGAGGALKLARLTKPIQVVIDLTRMFRILEIYETVEEAVRSFA